MSRALLPGCVLAVLVSSAAQSSAAQPAAPQPLQFNVLLSDWAVLGPFPKEDNSNGGTLTQFVPDDASLIPGPAVEYQGNAYAWMPWNRRSVEFRRVFGVWGDQGTNVVAYAWTAFESDFAGAAILAIGHDDSIAAWLNGEEIHRDDTAATACYLDHAKVRVQLKKGVNALLLKVGQGSQGWETIARVLPEDAETPLLTLATNRDAGGDLSRAPVLDVELLNSAGEVIRSLKASGFRNQSPGGLRFIAYGPDPGTDVTAARVSYKEQHLAEFSETFDWESVRNGSVKIPIMGDEPFAGQVVDAGSGVAVSGAQFWIGETRTTRTSNSEGRFSITHLNPLATQVWVAAPGYAAKLYNMPWPWPVEQTIPMQPGGKVLKGVVTSTDGQPIAGAEIRPGLYSGYRPRVKTDADGRFEFVSIPDDKTQLFPVIVKEGYVAKDRFGLELNGAVTEVAWQLELGAVATGRVTSKATGEPIAGVTVTAGLSRFASNSENASTTTDANGEFSLNGIPTGQMVLHGFSDNHAPAMHAYTASNVTPATIDFELDEGQATTGRVTEPDGTPVAGVWLVTDTWKGVRMFRREAHTDADGYFRLEHMPEPSTEVHVLKRDYVSKRDLMAVPGEHYEITLAPVIEHKVRVRLVDSDDPVDGLEIQQGYQWTGRDQVSWQSRSSYERNYDKAAGVFKIRTDEPANAKIFWRFRYSGYEDQVIEVPDSSSGAQQIDVVLQKAESIRGKVVSAETAEPLEGIAVALVSPEDRLRVDHYVQFRHPWTGLHDDFTGTRSITAADGSFSLPRPQDAAAVDIVVTAEGGGFQYFRNLSSWLEAVPADVEGTLLVLPYAAPSSIEGRVTIAGQPAAGEVIHAGWQPVVADGQDAWDLPFGVGGQVTCDADGRFRFPALGAGRYRISRVRAFDRPGGGGMSMYMEGDDVVLLPGQKLVHNIDQPAGNSFSGRAVDPQGNPLGGCVIEVSVAGDRARRIDAVRADADGYFTVKHVAGSKLDLEATHYSSVDGSMCGLGGEDFRGRTTILLPDDADIVLTLNAARGNSLTNAATLAGSVPPDFTAKPLDTDQEFTLSENWGKVVAIDFWATWCGPCMAVMPEMKALHEKYKDRDDVMFITVSLDQDEEQLRKVLKDQGLEFPVMFSKTGWDDPVARAFGVTGIPSSFVIGRDGRFAAEKVHGSNLAAAVADALAQPVDASYASGEKPGRLTVELKLKGTELGIPGARLKLTAVDSSGTTVRQDDLNVPGLASKLTWLYPELADGKLIAEVSAAGFETQSQEVNSPSAEETVSFSFTAPRTLTGTVATADGTAAHGLELTAHGGGGFKQTATTDADGSFRMDVLPGEYRLTVAGTDEFAPVAASGASATVDAEIDPDPLTIEVCRAFTLTGTVIGTDGEPAAEATVRWSGSKDDVVADEHGRFTLPGVPTVGDYQVYASVGDDYGAIRLPETNRQQPAQITIGKGLDRGDSSPRLRRNQDVPPLAVKTFDGSPVSWSAVGDRRRLLVFCELARPENRDFVRRAAAWANEGQVPLEVFSTDWGPGIAELALRQFDVGASVAWVGPSTLALAEEWAVNSASQAVLISPDGKVLDVPAAGELPQK